MVWGCKEAPPQGDLGTKQCIIHNNVPKTGGFSYFLMKKFPKVMFIEKSITTIIRHLFLLP